MPRSLLLLLTLSVSGCAYHSPYIDPTKDDLAGTSGRELSKKQQESLISAANDLSNANLYANTALAGTLGFGGYKLLTGGGGHQAAALAIGGGTIYGYQQVMYNETIAGLLNSAAAILACFDEAYTMPDIKSIADTKSKLETDHAKAWISIKPFYLLALDKVNASDRHYKSNIKRVIYSVNSKRAALNLSPNQSYSIITSAIGSAAASIPNRSELENALKPAEKTLLGDATEEQKAEASRIAQINLKQEKLTKDMFDWIESVDAAALSFTPDKLAKCRSTTEPPTVFGYTPGSPTQLTKETKSVFKIGNTSGNLSVSTGRKNDKGENYIDTTITTDSGNYFLEVTGKHSIDTPVTVFLTDLGKDEATTTLQFTVE